MNIEGARIEIIKFMELYKGKIDDALYEKKLSDKIIELSHKINKQNDATGHLLRQQIRQELWNMAIV